MTVVLRKTIKVENITKYNKSNCGFSTYLSCGLLYGTNDLHCTNAGGDVFYRGWFVSQ